MRSISHGIVASTACALALAGAGVAAGAPKAAVHRPQVLRIAAEPNGGLGFVQTRLTARSGRATLVVSNRSKVSHDLAIERAGAKKMLASTRITGGKSARLNVALRKGTYDYYFTGPGGAQAGMKGILTVS